MEMLLTLMALTTVPMAGHAAGVALVRRGVEAAVWLIVAAEVVLPLIIVKLASDVGAGFPEFASALALVGVVSATLGAATGWRQLDDLVLSPAVARAARTVLVLALVVTVVIAGTVVLPIVMARPV